MDTHLNEPNHQIPTKSPKLLVQQIRLFNVPVGGATVWLTGLPFIQGCRNFFFLKLKFKVRGTTSPYLLPPQGPLMGSRVVTTSRQDCHYKFCYNNFRKMQRYWRPWKLRKGKIFGSQSKGNHLLVAKLLYTFSVSYVRQLVFCKTSIVMMLCYIVKVGWMR